MATARRRHGVDMNARPVAAPDAAIATQLAGHPYRFAFFQAVRSANIDALLLPNIAWMIPHERRMGADAMKYRVPAAGTWPPFAEASPLRTTMRTTMRCMSSSGSRWLVMPLTHLSC